jgi:hypothetical protein
MNDDDRKRLRDSLVKADEETIREIIREAESFLASQLQAGLAADLRAMTLAVVLAAIIAGLVGGTATVLAAGITIWPHVIAIVVLLLASVLAFVAAIWAARPTLFDYAGNNPKYWATDVESGKSLTKAMAGQAALYAESIEDNNNVLAENNRYLAFALNMILWGFLLAAGLEFVIGMMYLGGYRP